MPSVLGCGLLNVITPFPIESGGIILNNNFVIINNHLQSGVLVDGSKGFTNAISGILPVYGYHLARFADITANNVGSGLPNWNAGTIQNISISSTSPSISSVFVYDGSSWIPGSYNAYMDSLSQVYDDTSPQLGGWLDVSENYIKNAESGSIILGGIGGLVFIGGTGIYWSNYQHKERVDILANAYGYVCREKNTYNTDLQCYDSTYPSAIYYYQQLGSVGPVSSSVYMIGTHNVIIGGYTNKITPDGSTILYTIPLTLDYNSIIGGYNNKIYIGSNDGDGYNISFHNDYSSLFSTYNTSVKKVNCNAFLSTYGTVINSGDISYSIFNGITPYSWIRNCPTHGISNNPAFQEVEFFGWGDFPNSNTEATKWRTTPVSGGVIDLFGGDPMENSDERYMQIGGFNSDSICSYELFVVISASGESGQIYTTAWSPFHIKTSNKRFYVSSTYMDLYYFSMHPNMINNNNVSRIFMSSGVLDQIVPQYASEDNQDFLWFNSKYDHGISGSLAIYQGEDSYLSSHAYTSNPYLTSDFTDDVAGYDIYGKRLIFHFRLPQQTNGFRASIWGRGCEFKGYSYPRTY